LKAFFIFFLIKIAFLVGAHDNNKPYSQKKKARATKESSQANGSFFDYSGKKR
jgi:hypothetical protein